MRGQFQLIAIRLRGIAALVGLLAAVAFSQSALAQFGQQSGKLTGSDATNQFGRSAAISADGNTAIFGAQFPNAAYVFTRFNGTWTEQTKLVASNAIGSPSFGASVALSPDGNIAVVGGTADNGGKGAVWVFTRSGSSWDTGTKLAGAVLVGNSALGSSVAISADAQYIVSGGIADNTNTGAGWVWVSNGSGSYTYQAKLAGASKSGASFEGGSAAISAAGDTVILGGRSDSSNDGAAWVYVRSGATWSEQRKLVPGDDPTSPAAPKFGSGVGLSSDGNTAVVGSQAASSAYFFTRSGLTWTFQQHLTANDAPFAAAMSADGNTAILGIPNGDGSVGRAMVAVRSSGSWAFQGGALSGSGATAAAHQGTGVGVSADGNTVVVGGSLDNLNVGAAWVFVQTPTVTDISPATGSTSGGTSVTITGTGFGGVAAVTHGVQIGGTDATNIVVVDANHITATTPAGSAGAADVAVTNSIGTATGTGLFTYITPPSVDSVTPSGGPSAGGTSITIAGSNFTNASAVTFGGSNAASFSVDSDSQITATTPAHSAGAVDVAVTTGGGTATKSGGFTFIAAPTITNVSPGTGLTTGGTSVTITGTNLTGASALTFGGTAAASYNVDSATQITATTPAHAAGAVNVVVTTPGGDNSASPGSFTFVVPTPTVSSVSPNQGAAAGGLNVTIAGTNFTNASAVKFGSTNATSFTVDAPTQISAVTPAHAVGAVNVSVTTAGGTGTKTNGFTYLPKPVITGINPVSDYVTGGAMVTIIGPDFSNVSAVKFGGTDATTFNVDSATKITATAPAHAAGQVDIVLTSPGGNSAAGAASKFTFDPLPSKTNIAVFKGGNKDGNKPEWWLTADKAGNLFGITEKGGPGDRGTVYMLTKPNTPDGKWAKTILHFFGGAPKDGTLPSSGLVADKSGRLYGLAGGGNALGTVYRLTPPASGDLRAAAKWTYEVLYNPPFNGMLGAPQSPMGGIVLDKDGALYFTTFSGGAKSSGTIIKLTPGSSVPWTGAVIYDFAGASKGGAFPHARLIIDKDGNVVGSTELGGASNEGAVYSFAPPASGKAKPELLYSFKGGDPTLDGSRPVPGVILGAGGALFGTTVEGGFNRGTIFKLTPPVAPSKKWTETVLWKFTGGSGDGEKPNGVTLKGALLYGTTLDGGLNSSGILFRLTPPASGFSNWTERTVYTFPSGAGGETPVGNVLIDKSGAIYGLTSAGGAPCSCGTVYMVKE